MVFLKQCILTAVYYVFSLMCVFAILYEAHPCATQKNYSLTESFGRRSEATPELRSYLFVSALAVTCSFLLALCILLTIIDILNIVKNGEREMYFPSVWLCIHIIYTLMLSIGWILIMAKCVTKLAQIQVQILLSVLNAMVSSTFLVMANIYKQQLREQQNISMQGIYHNTTEIQQQVVNEHNVECPPSYWELYRPT